MITMNIETADDIRDEVERARKKFPGTKMLFSALCEEVGELSRTLEDAEEEDTEVRRTHARQEALQVAAMAVRIIEEGDASSCWDQRVVHAVAQSLETASRYTMAKGE